MKKNILISFLILSNLDITPMLLDKDISSAEIQKMISTTEKELKKERKKSVSAISSELVDFNYTQKNINDLVAEYAQKLGINILYPETDTLSAQVTFNAGKITVAEAWDFIKMILEQAGYTLIFRTPGVYALMQNARITTEALPLFINVDFNQLPDTLERIRFMYIFSTISISNTKTKAELTALLNDILVPSAGTTGAPATAAITTDAYTLDETLNSIIFTARADVIKSVMQLLTVLDETGFQKTIEVVKLKYASAKDMEDIFKHIIKSGGNFGTQTSTSSKIPYFADTLRVINLDPKNTFGLNSIVIVGKESDVKEVKKFIKKYFDVAQEKGKSFFHVVDLEWLQAQDFAKILNSLVKPNSGGTAQATGTISSELTFDPLIQIVPEQQQQGSPAGQNQSGQNGGSSSSTDMAPIQNMGPRGGNKLVIACNSRDWQRIDTLIKQVDKPQKQVIIEGMVMDLDSEFTRALGAQIRTQGIVSSVFPRHMQAQAALLSNAILGSDVPGGLGPTNPNFSALNLVGDLSDLLNPGGVAATQPATIGSLTNPGVGFVPPPVSAAAPFLAPFNGTLGLISGGKERTAGAWAFFQLLSTHNSSKIFTRPVVMALNNQFVGVKSSVWKNLASGAAGSVSPTVSYEQVDATIDMKFRPLISNNNSVNLQIVLDLNLWAAPNDVVNGNMTKRNIKTNIFLKNGDVLVLGGLLTDRSQVAKNSVPFFERIPIIGNFFAARNKQTAKNQLFIVIRVTVVEPRTHAGMGPVTRAAADYMVESLADTEELFANLKDPITRWFFGDNREESPSEYLDDSISNLSKFDYGENDLKAKLSMPNPWHEKTSQKAGNIRIGWFSDVLSSNSAASLPADNQDMRKLEDMLANAENPFDQQRVTI